MRFLLDLDSWIGQLRPVLLVFGQLALIILGIHLASDRLDDHVGQWLAVAPIPWPEPEWPLSVGTWVAVVIEVIVMGWATFTLLRSLRHPTEDTPPWASRLHVNVVVATLCWLPIALAGGWVVSMVVEDALAPWLGWWPLASQALGGTAAILAVWRAGWTGWWSVTFRGPAPEHWSDGWLWAPPVLGVAGLALRHGLPIWGWM